jgi:hypothetical protein
MDFEGNFNSPDDIDGFEPVQQQDDFNGGMDDVFGLGNSPDDGFNQQAQVPEIIQENKGTALQSWEIKKEKELGRKRNEQEKLFKENLLAGGKELQEFQKKRKAHTEKIHATNRSEEKDNLQQLQDTLKNGTEWEKVAKFCDLKPKYDAKVAAQPQNTERMRTLLIDLKNEKKA